MESKDLNPIPTFHFNSPLEELKRLVDNYDYIALGGLVPLALDRKKMEWWLNKCWKILIQKKPLIKVHGFGINSFWLWGKYPWYSVDATSWLSSVRYGRDNFEKNRKIELFNRKSLHYHQRAEKALLLYKNKANEITRLWKKRGIIWDEK